jgi:thioredoxin-dependent peroxiredoxin
LDPLQNQPAPDFTLPADDGSPVRLSDYRGQRVILYFYPKADTPGCTTQACDFRDLQPQLRERGAVVLGVSPDSVEDVRAFREKFSLPFSLLADADHQVSEAYGVWKLKSLYGKNYWGVERSTFLIDEEGRIEQVYRKVDPEGHASQLLEALATKGTEEGEA